MKAKTKASLKILLSPCNVTIDPGFYDRIYCLLFYNEMDPNCLVTPAISLLHDDEELVVSGLSVILTCPQLHLNFYVPKRVFIRYRGVTLILGSYKQSC